MSEKAPPTYEYKVDKTTFIVTPVYKKNSTKTIEEALLNLIKKDCSNR